MKKLFNFFRRLLSWFQPEAPLPFNPIELERKVSFYSMSLQPGHRLFEYDPESDAINEKTDFIERKYENRTLIEFEITGKFIYISALNKKNARKKINQYLKR